MNDDFKILRIVFIAFLTFWGLLALSFWCGHRVGKNSHNATITIDTVTVVKTDTLHFVKVLEKPKPFKVIETITDTVRDTIFVLKDYNTVRIYDRNIIKDDKADVSIIDTVFRNELQGYSVKAKYYLRDTIKYIYTVVDKNSGVLPRQFMVGGVVGIDISKKVYVAPSLLYLNGKHSYTLLYDIINNTAQIGYHIKIF